MGSGSKNKEFSTKADRKFDKKLQFYAKVRDTVASLSAKKTISKKKKLRSRQKKLKAYNLSALSEFLPELKAPQEPPPAANLKLNGKSRKKLIEREAKQLRMVLNHPSFKLDPRSSIHQHLESTQPVVDNKPGKRLGKSGNKKHKGKKSRALSRPQSMEI